MKILITGAEGQLGQELVKTFQKNHQVIATTRDKLDFTNKEQTEEIISQEKPEWVIHSGAWTNVDGCAKEPEKAMHINGEGTRNVAEAIKKIGAKLVYISTNEVFDGKKKEPYLENDKTNPQTAYGRSKRLGETYSLEILGKDCSVVRACWLYGPSSTLNFPHKIVKIAKEIGFLKVVEDEISTPTYTPDFSEALEKLTSKNPEGIFHLVNEGYASRFEWAKFILESTGLQKIKIEPIKLKDFKRPSMPPSYTVLKNQKAANLGIALRDWKEAFNFYSKKEKFI